MLVILLLIQYVSRCCVFVNSVVSLVSATVRPQKDDIIANVVTIAFNKGKKSNSQVLLLKKKD